MRGTPGGRGAGRRGGRRGHGILVVHAYRRFEGSIGARRIPILRGVKRLKMKRKRNLKIGETGQPGTEGRGGDRATVATGTSDEAGRARRSRDLGDVNGVSREGPGSLDGWAVPAGNPAGAEAAVVRGVNVDRRNLARLWVLMSDVHPPISSVQRFGPCAAKWKAERGCRATSGQQRGGHTGVNDPSLATVRRRLADCAAASSILQSVRTNSARHEL